MEWWGSSYQFATPTTGFWSFAQIPSATWFDNQLSTIITSGSAVTTWNNRNPGAVSLNQAVAACQPTYTPTGFNGFPCLTLNGLRNCMPITGLSIPGTGATLFYLANINNDAGYGVVSSYQTGGSHWDRFDDGLTYPELFRSSRANGASLSFPTNGMVLVVYAARQASGPQYQIRRNGAQVLSLTTSFTFVNNIGGIGVGHAMNLFINGSISGGNAMTGTIAKVAIVPYYMSLAEIEIAEASFAWEVGLQSTLLPANHPYRNTRPTA